MAISCDGNLLGFWVLSRSAATPLLLLAMTDQRNTPSAISGQFHSPSPLVQYAIANSQ